MKKFMDFLKEKYNNYYMFLDTILIEDKLF